MITTLRYRAFLAAWNYRCAQARRRTLAVHPARRFGRFVGRQWGGRG